MATTITRGPAVSTSSFGGNRSRGTGAVRRVTSEIARYVGAASILVVGGIHAQQYYEAYYYEVPTIGTLFLLSFIEAGFVGAVLLAPVRLLGKRLGDVILVVLGYCLSGWKNRLSSSSIDIRSM
jgi:hypothetical protein